MSEEQQLTYCVKCRGKTPMKEIELVTMRNGRPAAKGRCGKCGCGVYKILSVEKK